MRFSVFTETYSRILFCMESDNSAKSDEFFYRMSYLCFHTFPKSSKLFSIFLQNPFYLRHIPIYPKYKLTGNVFLMVKPKSG